MQSRIKVNDVRNVAAPVTTKNRRGEKSEHSASVGKEI